MTKKVQLLTTNNLKTIKGEKLGYVTYILYLSPHRANSRGINLCPHASRGCAESCLFESGFGGIYDSVRQGRINKTEFFLSDKIGFMQQIRIEIERAIKKHEGKANIVIRLNGTSDIVFEKFKFFEGKNIFELFPDIMFYDYTKNYKRFEKELPKNYHLTFSRSEDNGGIAMDLISRGINVAMVFKRTPKDYKGYEVIDGDANDLRHLDKRGVIVGLRYKKVTGKGGHEKNINAISSGFVIDYEREVLAGVSDNLDNIYHSISKKVKNNLVV